MRKKKDIPPLTSEQKEKTLTLYETYKGLMLYTARQYTDIPDDIEDVVQDSLIAIMRNITTISSLDRCKAAAYIVLTIKRTFINCRYQENRLKTVSIDDASVQSAEPVSGGEILPLDADARLDVMYLMDSLSESDRMILEAWYLNGCSAEQLAAQMHCKPDSIRMMLSRVRKRAAKLLKEAEKNA